MPFLSWFKSRQATDAPAVAAFARSGLRVCGLAARHTLVLRQLTRIAVALILRLNNMQRSLGACCSLGAEDSHFASTIIGAEASTKL